jgi:pimeloyl-ACP methyl ester carboxylesterase
MHEQAGMEAGATSGFQMELPGGLRLRGRQWGTGTETCLLLHGFGEGSYVWSQFAPQLQDYCRVLAIDLRGHGDSDWDPDADYSSRRHAADLAHVIDMLALEQFVLVGHSLGGELALHLAGELHKRIRALAVVDYGPSIDPDVQRQSMELFRAAFRRYASIEEYASWLETTRPILPRQQVRWLARGALREDGTGGYSLKCDPALAYDFDDLAPTDTALRAIRCPVLLIRGRQSAILGMQTARRMARLLPNGELVVVPKAGHAVMVDDPAGFRQAVMPFVRRFTAVLRGRGNSGNSVAGNRGPQ